MRLTPKEPEIKLYEDGFAGKCELNRAETGERLSDLVENIEQPLVIALDGGWGTGKSFFLKCWVGAHQKENEGTAQTIYFDAFQHDYFDEPLLALTAALIARLPAPEGKDKYIKVIKEIPLKFLKTSGYMALAVASMGLSEITGPIWDAAISKGADRAEGELDKFWESSTGKQAAMEQFQNALTDLTTNEDGTTQKLVIVIDELDRCRPDYALSIMEIIKHFFAVDNVHFVLGANMAELENSVKARYGSGINAHLYLDKFVDVRLGLSERYDYNTDRSAPNVYFMNTLTNLKIDHKATDWAGAYFQSIRPELSPSLRTANRLTTACILTTAMSSDTKAIRQYASIGLAFIKYLKPLVYKKCLSGQLTMQDVHEVFNFPPQETKLIQLFENLLATENSADQRPEFSLYGLPHGYKNWAQWLAHNRIENFKLPDRQ